MFKVICIEAINRYNADNKMFCECDGIDLGEYTVRKIQTIDGVKWYSLMERNYSSIYNSKFFKQC